MAIHTFAAIYIGTYDVSLKVFEFTNRKKFHEVDHIRSRQELGKVLTAPGQSDMSRWKNSVKHWHSLKRLWKATR